MSYNLLSSAVNHPDPNHPYRGIFNKRTLDALGRRKDCNLTALAPIPYAPPYGPHSSYYHIPKFEQYSNHSVIRPRFLYWLPKSLFYSRTANSLKKALMKSSKYTDFDIVHACHLFPDGFGLVSVAKEYDVPITTTCHGHFLNNTSSLPPGVRRKVRITLKESDLVFCVSNALTKKAKEFANISHVLTVPIGAEPSNFPIEKRPTIRDNFGINSETNVILFCGQFIERKGVHTIIDSLENFPESETEYIFIGHSGGLKDKLESKADMPNSPSNIRILEGISTNELRNWFTIADIFLLPSLAEGRPTAIYEAMASQTPVISTDIEGVNEQVLDGRTGWLITPQDPEELSETLISALNQPGELEKRGIRGHNHLERMGWTWSTNAKTICDEHQNFIDK